VPTSKLGKRFGLIVRRRRAAAGLSQEKLAELAQLHPTYIGMVERGVRNPTLEASAHIAKALRVDLSTLIAEAESFRNASPLKSLYGSSTKVARRRRTS
jgi:transcriptional regulator with XRE-family HTH domain